MSRQISNTAFTTGLAPASGAFLNGAVPPVGLDPLEGDARFCGAVVQGSRLRFATVIRVRRRLMVWLPGCRMMELRGLEQNDVSRFNAAVRRFLRDSMVSHCTLRGPSNVDDMLTWMLFQKIETTLQLQREVKVDLVSPTNLSKWCADSFSSHPSMARGEGRGWPGPFLESIKVAAFVAAGGHVDD